MANKQSDAVASRRRFLGKITCGGLTAAGIGWPAVVHGRPRPPLSARPAAAPHELEVVSGTVREQGRAYGHRFAAGIHEFLERQIYGRFLSGRVTKDQMRRYAAACLAPIEQLSCRLLEHYEGMAAGAGLRLEEQVLISLGEELWHGGVLPGMAHCTAIAVGPPATNDGQTYVCQSWDWYADLYGKSQMVRWDRSARPSVISYSYPGLWMAAGLNSAGIALCWTSVPAKSAPGPVVGVPTYALVAHLLEQTSLDAAAQEVRRARRAGWFTFVLADGAGQLLNIEASPERVATQWSRGSLARVYYGTRAMTHTPPGQPVKYHPQCARMLELIRAAKGKINRQTVEDFYADHQSTICKHFNTLDVMIYDTTSASAFLTRGPGCLRAYQQFGFAGAPGAGRQ